MASTGFGTAIDDRYAPTTCSTVRHTQKDDQPTQYPPWYNGPREGEWDVDSGMNSFIDDRFGTEYSNISRVSTYGASYDPCQEPLTQHVLKNLQRATVENRLKTEVDIAREKEDENPVHKEHDAQSNAAKKGSPERKLPLKVVMGRHGSSTKLAGAMVDARDKNTVAPAAVTRASLKAQRAEAIRTPVVSTEASLLSVSGGLNGSRTIRLVSKDGRESFVQIPVFGTTQQSRPDATSHNANAISKGNATIRSLAPLDSLEDKTKQERQDGGRKQQRSAKALKSAAPETLRHRAETELASLHKDSSGSKPASLARVALSNSKSQATLKEPTGLSERVQASGGHATSLKSSTKDSAIAFSQPARRDSPPFQTSRTSASPASEAGKKASILSPQDSHQLSREDRSFGKVNAESQRSQCGSFRSTKSICRNAGVVLHDETTGEVKLPAGALARRKNNHQGSKSDMQQGHEKSSSTLEHSFARMGAFAQVPTKLSSSHTHNGNFEAHSAVQSAASLRPHKPKTIFAGRGWVSPHPLSEVGPPQSVIELHDEDGEALRISFEDFIGIAGSEARQYVHSHLNGASSSVHSRQGKWQDGHQTRSSSSTGTNSPGSQLQQVYSYGDSSYGQPSNYHFPTVESARSGSLAIAPQTYLYRPTAVYGDQQGRSVVYHASASGITSISAPRQLSSPMVEDSLYTSTLHGLRDDRPVPARAVSYNIVTNPGVSASSSYASPAYLHAAPSTQYQDWQSEHRQSHSPNVSAQPTASASQRDTHSIRRQLPYDPIAPSLPQAKTVYPRTVSGPLVMPLPNGQVQLSMPWDTDADGRGSLREYQRKRRQKTSFGSSATTMPDTAVYAGEEGESAPSKWSSVDRAERGYGSFRPAIW